MKTRTETLSLAALAAILTLAACGPGDSGNVTPDIDEEAVATVKAELDRMLHGRTSPSLNPRAQARGFPQPPPAPPLRRTDPDLDEDMIREYARNETSWLRRGFPVQVVLNEAETELLLERMRADKAARKEPGT